MTAFRQRETRARNCKSTEVIECGDAYIELLENYPCQTKKELRLREAYHIGNNNCVNHVIPERTQKEYREAKKGKMTNYNKEYRVKNLEKEKTRWAEYYEKNKDRINERKRLNRQNK